MDELGFDLLELATAVGREIGSWHLEREYHLRCAVLRDAETGAEISLSASTYPQHKKGRVQVSGVYPRSAHGHSMVWGRGAWGEEPPSVTVAAARGAKAIADDIRARFFPSFWPLWRETEKRATEDLVQVDQNERALERILAEAPDGRRSYGNDARGCMYSGGGWSGKVYITRYGADLELSSIDPDLAAEIVRLVSQRHTKKRVG